jgi:hypothetical protein
MDFSCVMDAGLRFLLFHYAWLCFDLNAAFANFFYQFPDFDGTVAFPGG